MSKKARFSSDYALMKDVLKGFETILAILGKEPRERPPARQPRQECGARCRDGHPCKRKQVRGKLRCPNHGGLSTGPKTPEGRARIAESNRRRAGKTG